MVNRYLYKKLQSELANDKILLLIGPRQSGKTTLLKLIASELEDIGEEVFFYNFDRTADLDFFSRQQKVEAFLKIRSLKKRLYIFIDEVQRKKNAGTFFKYFYDAGVNVKFIFSGSSSIEITNSFGDALTGRKRVFNLLPLSANEILEYTLAGEYQYAKEGEPLALSKVKESLEDLLIWGGYPEVTSEEMLHGGKMLHSGKMGMQGVTGNLRPQASETGSMTSNTSNSPTNQDPAYNRKLQALGELYESYVQKDVKDLLNVKNISGFNQLVKIIAYNCGENITTEEIVRQTGLHAKTVNNYLDILTGTMIIGTTENYNPDSLRLPKAKRYYFLDNGMRNYALGQLNSGFRPDTKVLARNTIFSEIQKLLNAFSSSQNTEVYHYQTYADNFIDFILKDRSQGKITPIYITYPIDTIKLGKGFAEFIELFKDNENIEKIIVCTESLENPETSEDIRQDKGIEINYLPLEQLILKLPELV